MYKRDQYAGLRDKLESGNVVAFVGAGLSMGAGLPSWIDLIRPLAETACTPLPPNQYITSDHLLDAAQYYENEYGRHALISHLQEQLDTTHVQSSPNHRLLTRLPVQAIFTTNYDDLIEQALRIESKSFNKIVRDTELPFWSKDKIQVVKLNGDLQQPDTIVITRNDYNTYFVKHPLLVNQLQAHLVAATFLFLGYSLTDPDFNLVFDQIAYQVGAHQRMSYAVMFDEPEVKLADLRRRRLYVFNLCSEGRDKSALLREWLQVLIGEGEATSASLADVCSLDAPPFANDFNVDGERTLLRQELAQHKRNLHKLQLKKVKYGIDVPISVLNQIEDEKEGIARIEEELKSLERNST